MTQNEYQDYFRSLREQDLDKCIYSLERAILFQDWSDPSIPSLFTTKKTTAKSLIEDSILSMQHPIIKILDFFWDLTYTTEGRREIIIYPQKLYSSGYGIDSSANNPYLPDKILDLNEWYEKIDHPKQRAIILDPSKSDPMTAAKLLGSLLVDDQLLIFRIRGMASDELLFACDFNGAVYPIDVKGHPINSGPPLEGMKFSPSYGGSVEYYKLAMTLNKIIETFRVLGIYRLNNAEDFYDICQNRAFIRDHRINNLRIN